MTLVEIRADIKDMTLTEKQSFTWKLVQEGQKATITTIQGYFRLGKVLDLLLGKDKLWKHYASHIQNESEFVEDAFHIKLSMAGHIRRVSKTFADRVGDRAIPFNRLLEALPVVNAKNIDTIVEDAENLPREGWENRIRKEKGLVPTDECLHEKTELWERCVRSACGKFLKKLGIEEKPKCKWVFYYKDCVWKSGCNKVFAFDSGTPSENSFKFCPFCGHILAGVAEDG